MKPLLLAVIALGLIAPTVHAERADRDKPLQIEAAKHRYDDIKQVGWFEGDVLMIKGTLRVEGARLDFRKDAEGYEYAVVTGAKGGFATFRQRRDPTRPGVEEFVEGRAERIEYDGRAETLKLITRATWRRLENDVMADEIDGNLIVYDSRNQAVEGSGGGNANGDGRSRTIFAPRRDPAPAPAPAVPLKPAVPTAPSKAK